MSAFPLTSFTDQVFSLPLQPLPNVGSGTDETPELRVAASSLLMEGFYSGRVLEGRNVNDIVAVQDELGRPILLSLSTGHRLLAVVSPHRDRDDREEHNLTHALPPDARVVAFAAGQSNQGDLYLAIAVSIGTRTELRVTRRLSNQVGATPWSAFETQWISRGIRDGGTVSRVLLGNEPVRRDAAPLIVLVTQEAGEAHYFEADSNLDAPSQPWKPLSLPENAGEVADIVVGRNRRGDGVYTLLEKSGTRRLFFVPQDPQAPTPELPIPAGLARRSALGVLSSGPRGETDLFLVGEGAFVLPWNLQRTGATPRDLVTLAAPAVASGLHNVLVCDDEQTISVWAIDNTDQLLFIPGSRPAPRTTDILPTGEELQALGAAAEDDSSAPAAEPVKWGAAVPGFRSGVRLIAPLRNRFRQSNSLIALGQGSDVRQLLETSDAATWDDKQIPVRDDTGTQEFQCYSTNLTITDASGGAFTTPPVLEITASERTEVLIDGTLHDIDERTPVRVTPDPSGVVTVMNRVRGIASPILRISGPAGGRVAVDPAAKVRAALGRIDGPDALRNAQTPEGTPVFPDIKDEALQDAAAGLKKLHEMQAQLPADGGRSRTYLSAPDLLAAQPTRFGMASDGDSLRFFDTAAGDALDSDLLGDWFTDALWSVAGPVLEAMRNIGKNAWAFVVEQVGQAWEFAVKLGERAYRFAVDCLAQVAGVVDWLLQNVLRAPFDALVKWLGFVFSWEDIVVTHNVLTNVVTQVFGKMEQSAGDFSDKVDGFFDVLIGEVRKLQPLKDPRADGGIRGSETRTRSELSAGLSPEDKQRFGGAQGFESSPAGTFASFHTRHSLHSSGDGAAGMMTAAELGPLEVLQATLSDLWAKVGGSLTSLVQELAEVFTSGKLTLNELIRRIAAGTTIAALEVMRGAVVSLARVAGSLIRFIREKLTQPLSVPFLSFLYKKVAGKEMTALSGFMLLLAVPATSLYKLLTSEAPFPFKPVLTAEGLEDTAAPKKPETHGLDTLVGAGFWLALTGGGAIIGGVFLKLYRTVNCVKIFGDTAYRTAEGVYQAIGPLIGLGMAMLKLANFVMNALWLQIGAGDGWRVPSDIIVRCRWIVSGVPVLAGFLALLDPSNIASAIARLLSGLLDMLLSIIWCGMRIYNHVTSSKTWLVAVDVAELLTSTFGNLATVLGGMGTLIPEGLSKTFLIAAGYGCTALWLPAVALTSGVVPYIPLSELVYPIA